ncbi:MAG TPA: aromatic ring-opening dioxygenase LigA [Dermatophilaceae bacterium]|nr:aromatic ring-opening dioxygenase LigA [Dermatophilaceae bacterium]
MSNTTTNPRVKLIGVLVVIAGFLMIVAGGVTWGLVTSQLKAENIVVAEVTPENPGRLAGKPVAGPFTAYAQAAAINHHALDGAGGRTYAQLGDDAKALKAKLAASGVSKEDIAKDQGVIDLADTRTSAMNGSFLRASLFTSVVAFGVAALVIGLGVLFALLGFALMQVASATVATVTSTRAAEPTKASA